MAYLLARDCDVGCVLASLITTEVQRVSSLLSLDFAIARGLG